MGRSRRGGNARGREALRLLGARSLTTGPGEVLPRQLTHHFQQSLVLLFELFVLVFDVIEVLRGGRKRQPGVILVPFLFISMLFSNFAAFSG